MLGRSDAFGVPEGGLPDAEMSKELTWVGAACVALENSVQVWMTAPDLVREINRTGIRELRSAYPQAVRSLRSALNFQSRKENGLFSRREEDCSICFALRSRAQRDGGGGDGTNTKKVHSGRSSPHVKAKANKATPILTPPPQPLVNGLPCHPHPNPHVQSQPLALPPLPLHPIIPAQPYTIEIDPSSCKSGSEPAGNFCLPSPLQSILGPIKTLHCFNETAPTNHRPVRQARMRKSLKDQENSSPDAMVSNATHDATPIHVPPPVAPPPVHEVLRLEICHPVPSLLSKVDCVRYTCPNPTSHKSAICDEDPCMAQGERKRSGRFEIKSLDLPISSESELDDIYDDDDDDDDDTTSMGTSEMLSDSDTESSDQLFVQPTPRAKLLIHKPLRRYSSSCSEGLKADERLLMRETPQTDCESAAPTDAPSLPPPGRQHRTFSADLGRLQGANSSLRVSSRSSESKGFDSMKKPSSNGFVSSCPTLNQLDQRRYVSTLFFPTSLLVGENMKLLLNMDAYKGLSSFQKRKLQSLLPSVDRGTDESNLNISGSSFNNAFYSSALREWQEHLALGYFTPEYKARIRGEEKRRTTVRAEDLWKQRFYEETWGDKKEGADDDHKVPFPVPYYPHSHHNPATASSQEQHSTAACLRAIMDGYHKKDINSKESVSLSVTSPPSNDSKAMHSHIAPTPTPSLTSPPPPSRPPTRSPGRPPSATGRKNKLTAAPIPVSLDNPRKSVSRTKPLPPSSTSTTSSPGSVGKNHLVKRLPPPQTQSPQNKNLLPALLKSKAKVVTTNKKVVVNKKTTDVKRLGVTTKSQQSHGKSLGKSLLHSIHTHSTGQYLTRLPPKLPYQTLLSALEQASKDNNTAGTINTVIAPYIPPSKQHTHSVFHDHFALLSKKHIPTEFSLPITSLPVTLSRDVYRTYLMAKVVRREHSYSKTVATGDPSQQQCHQRHQQRQERKRELTSTELKLSVPRSVIRTKEGCECDGRALVFCSRCHSLYHSRCVGSEGTLCPKCATLVSLLAS